MVWYRTITVTVPLPYNDPTVQDRTLPLSYRYLPYSRSETGSLYDSVNGTVQYRYPTVTVRHQKNGPLTVHRTSTVQNRTSKSYKFPFTPVNGLQHRTVPFKTIQAPYNTVTAPFKTVRCRSTLKLHCNLHI